MVLTKEKLLELIAKTDYLQDCVTGNVCRLYQRNQYNKDLIIHSQIFEIQYDEIDKHTIDLETGIISRDDEYIYHFRFVTVTVIK